MGNVFKLFRPLIERLLLYNRFSLADKRILVELGFQSFLDGLGPLLWRNPGVEPVDLGRCQGLLFPEPVSALRQATRWAVVLRSHHLDFGCFLFHIFISYLLGLLIRRDGVRMDLIMRLQSRDEAALSVLVDRLNIGQSRLLRLTQVDGRYRLLDGSLRWHGPFWRRILVEIVEVVIDSDVHRLLLDAALLVDAKGDDNDDEQAGDDGDNDYRPWHLSGGPHYFFSLGLRLHDHDWLFSGVGVRRLRHETVEALGFVVDDVSVLRVDVEVIRFLHRQVAPNRPRDWLEVDLERCFLRYDLAEAEEHDRLADAILLVVGVVETGLFDANRPSVDRAACNGDGGICTLVDDEGTAEHGSYSVGAFRDEVFDAAQCVRSK